MSLAPTNTMDLAHPPIFFRVSQGAVPFHHMIIATARPPAHHDNLLQGVPGSGARGASEHGHVDRPLRVLAAGGVGARAEAGAMSQGCVGVSGMAMSLIPSVGQLRLCVGELRRCLGGLRHGP